jgi:hypothetical protein
MSQLTIAEPEAHKNGVPVFDFSYAELSTAELELPMLVGNPHPVLIVRSVEDNAGRSSPSCRTGCSTASACSASSTATSPARCRTR